MMERERMTDLKNTSFPVFDLFINSHTFPRGTSSAPSIGWEVKVWPHMVHMMLSVPQRTLTWKKSVGLTMLPGGQLTRQR